MKLLTVTVPCYNSQDYMEKCVNSLLPGGERVEIIIIDDGSKDATGEIADRFAAQYPSIVKVVHQENGGHGEGINQGLKHATGKFFKVVDSDDWVNEDYLGFLDYLETQEDTDLVITNYYYNHADGKGDRSIRYANALPVGKVFTWDEVGTFQPHQILTIHSCTFRTEMLRKTRLLPKHVFYEDNLMVYQGLTLAKKMSYLDIDLYRYFIGRADQSVQQSATMKRYAHQILVTEQCFNNFHLDDVENKHQRKYMKHELFMMFGIAVMFARLNKTDKADEDLEVMWKNCREFDQKWADYFRHRSLLKFICIPGKFGRNLTEFIYHLANKIVRFN